MQQKRNKVSIRYALKKTFITNLVNTYLNYQFIELKGKTLSQLGWKFGGFQNLETARGYCNKEDYTIEIGFPTLTDQSIDSKQFVTIVLHEICHAIEIELYGESNHEERYEKICYSVGKQTNVSGYMIYSETASATDFFNKNEERFY